MTDCVWKTGSTQADGTSGLPESCKKKACNGVFKDREATKAFSCYIPAEDLITIRPRAQEGDAR